MVLSKMFQNIRCYYAFPVLFAALSLAFLLPAPCWSAAESELYFSKGLLAFDEGDFEQAVIHFERALGEDPENDEILFKLGQTYSQLKDFDEAISAFKKGLDVNPELDEAHFELGFAYFSIGEYKVALQEFDVAKKVTPSKGSAYYYEGLINFREDRFTDAVSSFQETLELAPSLAHFAHYYLGVSYYRLQDDQKALAAFQEAVKIKSDTKMASSSRKFITAIRARLKQKRRWSAFADITWEYDDNVTLKPTEAIAGVAISDRGDWRATFNLGGAYKVINKDKFSLSGKYSFYQSVHRRLRQYNLTGNQLASNISWKVLDRIRLNTLYSFNYYELDETRYLESHAVLPSMTLVETSYGLLQLFSRFQDKDYLQDPENVPSDRDGRNLMIGFGQYLFFLDNKGYTRFGYSAEKENAEGRDWDFRGQRVFVDFKIPVIKGINTLINFSWEKRNYEHINSIFEKRRRDNEYDWSFEIEKEINEYFSISFKFNRVVNDSEIAFYDYEREISSFNFTARF